MTSSNSDQSITLTSYNSKERNGGTTYILEQNPLTSRSHFSEVRGNDILADEVLSAHVIQHLRDETGVLSLDEELTVPSQLQPGRQDTGNDDLHGELQTPLLSSTGRTRSHNSTSRRHRRDHFRNQPSRQAPLNVLNYLNAATYAGHLFVSWGIGVWGLDGTVPTRWEITTRYETLVTPAAWAYHLWAPILVLEGVFTVAQLVPHYRARPVVQAGTSYFFFYTFLLQTAWTIFFSFRLFIFSFISVVAALISLLCLLVSQERNSAAGDYRRSRMEYALFRFPMYLHAGWMFLMVVDHMNLLFRRYYSRDTGVQLAVDMVSLGLMLPVATFYLTRPNYQNFIIPLVILWSYMGVGCRLLHPPDSMRSMYDATIIEAVRLAAFILAGTLACCIVPAMVVTFSREFCIIQVIELESE